MSKTPIYDEMRARYPDMDDIAEPLADRVDGWCEDRHPAELTEDDGVE